MKTFLAVFTGTAAAMAEWKALDAEQRASREQAGLQAWTAWVTTHESAIIDHGTPLGKTKKVSAAGIADIRNNLAAYAVVQAESHAAAARLFEAHPHFTLFPGDAIEVMECLPIPQR